MLNRPGRAQTKKHRPTLPVARQFAPWLDEAMERENYLPVSTIKHGWNAMRLHLGLPGDAEAGEKLVCRSVATICRRTIGEANWVQGKMMLGHNKSEISDIYAVPDPANLGLALAATESLIDEIEKRVPGAFYRAVTARKRYAPRIEGGIKREISAGLKAGAGEGNRTLVFSLGSCCSTIELHPQTGEIPSVRLIG